MKNTNTTPCPGIIPCSEVRTPTVYSNAAFLNTGKSKVLEALDQKGRVLLKVEVSLYDRNGTTVMQAVFEWFVTKR